MLGFAKVNTGRALRARDAVDRRARGKIAIEGNRPPRIVVARHGIGDAVWVAIGVENSDDRNPQPLRFFHGQLLFVGIDDKEEIRNAAHILDSPKRPVELIALAGHHQALLLGKAEAPELKSSSNLRRRWIEAE